MMPGDPQSEKASYFLCRFLAGDPEMALGNNREGTQLRHLEVVVP